MPEQLQVHIVPLGWELDRAVLPFLSSGETWKRVLAHRVHFVVPNPAGAKGFDRKAKAKLEAAGIDVEVHAVDRDRDGEGVELEEVMRMTAELCHREAHGARNQVSINLSAASKLAAFAAGLGGMAYQYTGLVRFYYVQPRSYAEEERTVGLRLQAFHEHGMSIGVRGIQWIEPLPLNQPGRVEMQVLAFLSRRPGATYLEVVQHLIPLPKSPLGKAYADLLAPDVAKQLGWSQSKEAVQAHRGSTQARGLLRTLRNKAVTSLRRITAPLESLDLVRHATRGREGVLELTSKGRLYALLARDEREPPASPHRQR